MSDVIDLTWLVDMIADALKGSGPGGVVIGALLLFAVQALGGARFNVSGWVAGFFSKPQVHDLLHAELQALIAALFKTNVAASNDPHTEFRKIKELLKPAELPAK